MVAQSLFLIFTQLVTKHSRYHLILFLVRNGSCAFTESIPEPPSDNFQVPHTASASSMTSCSFDRPSIPTDLSSRISTGSADFLLDMKGDSATTTAQSVRLVAPFTK